MITRRGFLIGSAAACVGVIADMRFLEPRWLKIRKINVKLSGKTVQQPFKILHLSDFHASENIPISFIRKSIEVGIAQKPDLICLTGDFISRRIPDRRYYIETLKLLSDHAPCYACLGNHDGGSWVRPFGGYADLNPIIQFLKEANITLLFNSSTKITIKNTAYTLVGIGDYWAGDTKPANAFCPADSKQEPVIVLSHNPDSKELLRNYAWDLMLCGHTHGGQLSLPFVGTPFAPVRDHRYVSGLNEWEGRQIYTTRGIGNLHGLRFNCRPEVSILDVT